MKLGLIIESTPDERAISKLVARISKQSGYSVDISRERIRFGRGFGNISKNLLTLINQLQKVGSEIIVVIADNDRKSFNKRLDSLKSKIEGKGISIPVAIGITVETIEAWLLADEQALNSALGGTQISKLPLPSKIKHPKEEFLGLVKEHAKRPVLLDDYNQIADKVDKKVLDRRCKSFRNFHNELRNCLRKVRTATV
ncbi:DUF4276 family protein [candidate division WOR-3 bacterium]|nr:DUF4276 family protein [candidate division WOR-3 bacterium]